MAGNADFRLLQFENYESYLTSFIRTEDYRYLSSMDPVRRLVRLGYRSTARVYEEAEFNKIRAKMMEFMNPKVLSSVHYSDYFKGTDAALAALMRREEPNLLRQLSTIIFLQVRQRSGFDISGYIDYQKSLHDCTFRKPDHTNWRAVFEGRELLKPKPTDLSYYDWHKGIVNITNSDNFESIKGRDSLIFKHKGDHKLIPVCAKPAQYGENVHRVMILSELYGFIILYDHVIR
ncbi:cilia- and flagella-associated protein 299 [Drosophila mojavensis]|uniref:Cilia- and flagella-associated protein 299 n=1 Tax=Drosophila mojavensis TaxID=7230 RepID=B4KIS1_DROMO|nr:cilia- and flagella-associated protein 299 [Drosophila mojavensis]EDW12427.2 uncharacterized protein Dmoj_GI10061 [Drosophila mojavensis]